MADGNTRTRRLQPILRCPACECAAVENPDRIGSNQRDQRPNPYAGQLWCLHCDSAFTRYLGGWLRTGEMPKRERVGGGA